MTAARKFVNIGETLLRDIERVDARHARAVTLGGSEATSTQSETRGMVRSLKRVITLRFRDVPSNLDEQLAHIDPSRLFAALQSARRAKSLDDALGDFVPSLTRGYR